jgi:predicted transposase YdaD
MRDIANCAKMEGRMEERMERSIHFAIKLLKRNTSIEDVIDLTELSGEQVQELSLQLSKA